MDRRSDIFSLGIVLYEMVTDHRPFLGHSEMSILEMVRECRVARPSTLNPRIPEKLENVIMRSLARDAEDRYQDAAEMNRDLERVLHDWQSPQAGTLARFMELLFDEEERDEEERDDSEAEPAAAAEQAPAMDAPALDAVAVDAADAGPAEGEPAGVLVVNEELDVTPPPAPLPPDPEPPPAPESLSQKLLKKFGIK